MRTSELERSSLGKIFTPPCGNQKRTFQAYYLFLRYKVLRSKNSISSLLTTQNVWISVVTHNTLAYSAMIGGIT